MQVNQKKGNVQTDKRQENLKGMLGNVLPEQYNLKTHILNKTSRCLESNQDSKSVIGNVVESIILNKENKSY